MSAPLSGQVSVTGTAQPLSTSPVVAAAYIIKAPFTNIAPVFLGPAGVTVTSGWQLDPGEALNYEHGDQHGATPYLLNISDYYAAGTAGDKVTWLATPLPSSR